MVMMYFLYAPTCDEINNQNVTFSYCDKASECGLCYNIGNATTCASTSDPQLSQKCFGFTSRILDTFCCCYKKDRMVYSSGPIFVHEVHCTLGGIGTDSEMSRY